MRLHPDTLEGLAELFPDARDIVVIQVAGKRIPHFHTNPPGVLPERIPAECELSKIIRVGKDRIWIGHCALCGVVYAKPIDLHLSFRGVKTIRGKTLQVPLEYRGEDAVFCGYCECSCDPRKTLRVEGVGSCRHTIHFCNVDCYMLDQADAYGLTPEDLGIFPDARD